MANILAALVAVGVVIVVLVAFAVVLESIVIVLFYTCNDFKPWSLRLRTDALTTSTPPLFSKHCLAAHIIILTDANHSWSVQF